MRCWGPTDVQTYIAGGNAVFRRDLAAGALAKMIREGIAQRFGFALEVFMVTPQDMQRVIADTPLPMRTLRACMCFF